MVPGDQPRERAILESERDPQDWGGRAELKGKTVDLALLEQEGLTEIFATALPSASDDLASLLVRLGEALEPFHSEILEMRIFGALEGLSSCTDLVREVYGPLEWPLTCLEGAGCSGGAVAGVQLHAVTGPPVHTVRRGGLAVGRVFEDGFLRRCILGRMQSSDPGREPERQTRDTIRQMLGCLGSARMNIHDLVRTWFFVSDILDWYPAFNKVRSEIYSREGVFERLVPASTGIGARNSAGTALVASALAVRPKIRDVRVRAVPSPLQCPALEYGSSFSRAAEVVTPDCRFLFVSGTASIDLEGQTIHRGDVGAQIEHTFEVVTAILRSRSMDLRDVVWGNAYFKDRADGGRLKEPALRRGLPLSRIVVSQNDICREDLLFELEVEAVKAQGRVAP